MKKAEDLGKDSFCWAIVYEDFYIITFFIGIHLDPLLSYLVEDDKKMEVDRRRPLIVYYLF